MTEIKPSLIFGLGDTGVSLAKYLYDKGEKFYILDHQKNPPSLNKIKRFISKDSLILGSSNLDILDKISKIIVSPGVPPSNAVLNEARSLDIPIITDLDIFFKETTSKIILITGTNGKSTVVRMLENVLKKKYRNLSILAGGNIGIPVLDLLESRPDVVILEVSSFQLHHTQNIKSNISVLLNLEEDHLDWHKTLESYYRAKKRVFENTNISISRNSLAIKESLDINFLTFFDGYESFILDKLNESWHEHNRINLLSVLTVCFFFELKKKDYGLIQDKEWVEGFLVSLLDILKNFSFLPHRFEILGKLNEVIYVNDSKATNIDSTRKAIISAEKLSTSGEIILICGGDSKGQNFSKLSDFCKGKNIKIFLIGRDAKTLESYFLTNTNIEIVLDLESALERIKIFALPGSIVLLSPACSSKDMYEDYRQRGNHFKNLLGFR